MRRVLLLAFISVVTACSSATPTTEASTTTTASSTTSSSSAPSTTGSPSTTAAASGTTTPATTVSWTTFGATVDRTGAVASGPDPSHLRQAWASPQLDGDLYGEPLVFDGRVIVATEANSVYAFDAATARQLWTVNLGEPIPRSALACGNIDPTGVTGTPVIDPATGVIYLVAFVQPGRHDLVALDTTNGAVRWRQPADPPDLDPLYEQQRSALTIANGRVYMLYGGLFGDCGPYKGAVVSYPLDGRGPAASWVVPTRREGGLWAPSGAAVDSAGNLFVATGNAASTDPGAFDYGNTVVRLTPDLQLADYWAPEDWASLSAADADLGSQGPVLLDGGLVFVAGKNGVGYLLDGGHLGGIGKELAQATVCDGGAFGGAAAAGDTVVVGCSSGPAGVRISGQSLSSSWHAEGGRTGAPMIAGGTAWLVSNGAHLLALDAATGEAQADIALDGDVPGFPTPAVLPDAVYVPAGRQLLSFTAG
jgi:outer membrane protein assembly factor BamB